MDAEPRGSADPRPFTWTLAATSFGFALIQLDVTIVNVALPRIGTELATGVAGLQWVVDAYALVFSALLLVGRLSSATELGARRIYLGRPRLVCCRLARLRSRRKRGHLDRRAGAAG